MLTFQLSTAALLTSVVLGSRATSSKNDIEEVISVADDGKDGITTIFVPVELSKDPPAYEHSYNHGYRHHGFFHHHDHHCKDKDRPAHRPGKHNKHDGSHPANTKPRPTGHSTPKPSPSPASSPSPSSSPQLSHDEGYEATALFHHNIHRHNHSAPSVTWSAELTRIAKSIADGCVYAHDMTKAGGGYGQNIAAGVRPDNISAVITDMFYNGEINWFDGLYGKAYPGGDFERYGHFTQLIWRKTQAIGCYTADCSADHLRNTGPHVQPFFTVCNYQPPGNVVGAYAENILPPLGHATAQWDTKPS